jgi:hypothetical protein
MIDTLAKFTAALPPARVAGNPVIAPNPSTSWSSWGACDPCVVVNPLDSTQLLLFWTGADNNSSNITTTARGIGRATASVSNPTVWTQAPSDRAVLLNAGAAWGTVAIQLGSAWVEGTRIYLAYTASNGSAGWYESVGVAYSDDAGLTFTQHPSNPIFTYQSPETSVELPCIFKEGGTYYMYFSYRDTSLGGSNIMGIKLATATSLAGPWTRASRDDGYGAGVLVSGYREFHQVIKLPDGKYVLTWEQPADGTATPTASTRWNLAMATATSPSGPFTSYSGNPVFTYVGSNQAWDNETVSTGAWAQIGGSWYLFYSGTSDLHYWPMGVAVLPDLSVSGDTTDAASLGASQGAAYQSAGRLTVAAGPVVGGKVTLSGHRIPGSVVYVSR